MIVFYDEKMSVDVRSVSPSASKPSQVVDDWRSKNLPVKIHSFPPAHPKQIAAVHDRRFAQRVLNGTECTGFGCPDVQVAQSCLWTCGSFIAAAHHAVRHGLACSPTSGFHHAGFDEAGGFCTFNGLMVAAADVLAANYRDIGRIGILDLDYHYGDGTDDIIQRLGVQDQVVQISGRHSGRSVDQVLGLITDWIDGMECDLLFYQAGADMHVDDPLGGFMTTEQLRQRDRQVFSHCKEINLPVAWNLAGGYQVEPDGSIPKILELHRNTASEAIWSRMQVCIDWAR